MDLSAILTTALVVATAGGGWFQGHRSGVSNALQTSADTVGMLATSCGELRAQIATKDARIEYLEGKLAACEALAGHPPTIQ